MKFILMQLDLRPTRPQHRQTFRYFGGPVPIDALKNAQFSIGGLHPDGPDTRGNIHTPAKD